MVLGCILCRQPLVTYTSLKLKKQTYLRGRPMRLQKHGPTTAAEKQAKIDNPNEIKETQLVLSKCGHVFHKSCLKLYLTAQPNGGGPRRDCPHCFKPIALGQTIQVFLNVESHDLLMEKVKAVCRENDDLHEKITELKSDLGKKHIQLNSIDAEIVKRREGIKHQAEEVGQLQLVKPVDSIRKFKEELAFREQIVQSLTDQNTTLISLIEVEASRSEQLEKLKGQNQGIPPEIADRFRLDRKKSSQIGVFFGNSSLCNEYHNPIPLEDQDQRFFVMQNRTGQLPPPPPLLQVEKPNADDFNVNGNEHRAPMGAKYLEYREKQLQAQANVETIVQRVHVNYTGGNVIDFKKYNTEHVDHSGRPKSAGVETIRKIVEQARRKRLKKK